MRDWPLPPGSGNVGGIVGVVFAVSVLLALVVGLGVWVGVKRWKERSFDISVREWRENEVSFNWGYLMVSRD